MNGIVVLMFGFFVQGIKGHGMMMDPPNRSSLWRFNDTFLPNYDDNQNFCGGFSTQWNIHDGKCGVCGDNFGDPIPRINENTGLYGTGYIAAEYPSGSVINVNIILTANHLGKFMYSLCKLEDSTKPEENSCFKPLLLEDGSESFNVNSDLYNATNAIQLPENFTCKHCVLRWHYQTGNSWGVCSDGQGALGCGPQETFRSCTDIAIY